MGKVQLKKRSLKVFHNQWQIQEFMAGGGGGARMAEGSKEGGVPLPCQNFCYNKAKIMPSDNTIHH